MAFPNFFSNIFGDSTSIEPAEKEINTIYIQEEARGSSGTEIYAGYYGEEYLDDLKGTERAKEFDKIRRSDSQAKMLLSATKGPIRGAAREIKAASDDPEHKRHAALCRKALFEDIKLKQFVNEALTIQEFGHSLFEKTHIIKQNEPVKDEDGNVILNSYIGFKKLGWISPKTIESWNFNRETKELESVRQLSYGDLSVDYNHPVRHLVILTLEREGDNYEGISLLRACYGNALRKRHYMRWNAIGIEKSMPIPTAEIPAGKEATKEYTNLVKSLRDFTNHQKNFLTYPAGWNVQLSNGTKYDPSKLEASIDNEDKRMAKAFLANFLELGLSGTGAFALSNDLSDFFLSGLVYIAGIIEDAIDDLIKELVILNFGPQSKYPKFEFTGIDDKAGEELARIIDMMVKGKVIIPDDVLESHFRKRMGLPERSEDGQRELPAPAGPGGFGLSERVRSILKV